MWHKVTFVEFWEHCKGYKTNEMEAATIKTARKTALQSGVLRYRIVI